MEKQSLMWMCVIAIAVPVPASAVLPPDPGCQVPDTYTGPDILTSPPMPVGGQRCFERMFAVQVIYHRCEERYCCETGCDCNSDLHEHTGECEKLGRPVENTRDCYVKHAGFNDTIYKCCDDYVEDDRAICVERPCRFNNGGCSHQCVEDSDNGLEYHCDCPIGLLLDPTGKTCLTDPCLNSGCSHSCVNDGNADSHCECPSELVLEDDGLTCAWPDPCLDNNAGCSHYCLNDGNGDSHCDCPSWLVLEDDGYTCAWPDPCFDNNAGCSHDCVNDGNGDSHCDCPSGLVLEDDGLTCAWPDPCLDNNAGCSHNCVNDGNGDSHCDCPSGLVLEDDGYTCASPDSCLDNNAGCSDLCVDEGNGYSHCECPSELVMSTDGFTCTKPSPCLNNKGGCSHDCIDDGDGDYHCACPSGFVLTEDDFTCATSDPCANSGCSDFCVPDGNGRPHCECPSGLQLNSDGLTCSGSCSKEDCPAPHTCTADVNGVYYCDCADGYKLFRSNTGGLTCVDIDECSANYGGCSDECENIPGSHRCHCPSPLVLQPDGKTCLEVPEVTPQPVGKSEDDGPPIAVAIGIPVVLILLLLLLVPLVCFCRRRRQKAAKASHVGDDTRAFSNSMYDVTPGQTVVPMGERLGGDQPEGAVGPDPHYETLPEKKGPLPGGDGPIVEPLYLMPCDKLKQKELEAAEEEEARYTNQPVASHYVNHPAREAQMENMANEESHYDTIGPPAKSEK